MRVFSGTVLRRPPPEIHVRYREGTGIVLRAVSSTHGANALADFTDRLAWVGGWGRDVVVLFPNGPRRPGPYAVPATAMMLRTEGGAAGDRGGRDRVACRRRAGIGGRGRQPAVVFPDEPGPHVVRCGPPGRGFSRSRR
ncbi:hypothetical protein AB0M80_17755 [Amycolatopsis sp. NPDC051045]|uniref:hypothetical protein n=1 Tax=Amycolatopsis sp. NPDC051045 TaxID=3156922 RepID=UPI0034346A77